MPSQKNLYFLGAGGNASVVASTINDINLISKEWNVAGFFDDSPTCVFNEFFHCGSISVDTIAPYLEDPLNYFYWSLMSVKIGKDLLPKLLALNIPINRFATIIHPTAVISSTAKIGFGVSIHPFVSIGPDVSIGDHIHCFAQSFVGHGANIGSFSYLANNVSVGARVQLNEGSYVGTNAAIRENVSVGPWSIIGMGSVVLNHVSPGTTVIGVPAKPFNK